MTQTKRTGQQSAVSKIKKQQADIRKKNRRMNHTFILILVGLCVFTALGFGLNIIRVMGQKEPEVTEETMTSDTGPSMKNDQYLIGNNPTDIQKDYFQQLTDAINAQDNAAIAEAVVYNFVSDYFTWTNKDGNYEIGGLQYIYGSRIAAFEQWSRYNFYQDLDLYLTQLGRDNLIEVASITTDQPTTVAPEFATLKWDDAGNSQEVLLESYEVNVSWTYKNANENFPTGARFFVVNNEGRWEIAEFYDYESIHEWEVSQGIAG